MIRLTTSLAVTLRGTYSFYVPANRADRILACSEIADAVVVSGAAGPQTVRRLRAEGWQGAALFDRAAYVGAVDTLDIDGWFDEQRNAGADRLLTPGCFVGSGSGHAPFAVQIEAEASVAREYGAACVLAIDYRWLTNPAQHDEMLREFETIGLPVALVLADRADPLGHPGAVDALVALTRRIDQLSVLRVDHGGIGALAFDAAHASIGLSTTYRHAVPPDVTAQAIPHDQTARVFVLDLMDWFAGSTIGGWSTVRVADRCKYSCCQGQRIDRFLDVRRKSEADIHNRTVLAVLAEEILSIPDPADRRRAFGRRCFAAVEHYGIMGGLTSEIKPKFQLQQWSQYA
jgi:hypothetical protein